MSDDEDNSSTGNVTKFANVKDIHSLRMMNHHNFCNRFDDEKSDAAFLLTNNNVYLY